MTPLRRFLLRLVSLFRSGRAESDLAREIGAHLQLLEDQFVEKGMTRGDARYAARRTFGGVEQAKEHHRDARSFRWLAGWPMDLRLGARMLLKSPGLTVIGVVALAVAMGAGAAYLEILQDALYPTLRGAGARRIVGVRVRDMQRNAPERRLLYEFAVWRTEATSFEQLGAVRYVREPLLTTDGRSEPARAVEATAAAFRVIPAAPLMGRVLTEDDERPGAPPVAVIGHDLWLTRFNGDPHVLGRTVQLGRVVHTIVGLMPEGFAFPINNNLWTPLRVQATGVRRGEGDPIEVFGRLKEAASVESARAELNAMLDRAGEGSAGKPALRVEVRPYIESLLSDETSRPWIERILYAFNLLFVFLLAICGVNVATLVFARTATREAEITVRTALGASRRRICAQLFAEALVLSLVAALVGLVVAALVGQWLGRLVIEAIGEPLPFWWNASLSLQTVLYALVLALFAALIVGVMPALKATGAHLQSRLREAGATGSTLQFGRLWTGVIVMQVAITVIFIATLVSLGWTTYRERNNFDVTFVRQQFLTARLMPGAGAEGNALAYPGYRALSERLKEEAGVMNVSYSTGIPGTTSGQFFLEFATPEVAAGAKPHDDGLWVRSARVGPDYFETMGIPLVAGRLFTESEVQNDHPVAIVDETFVRLVLGGRRALGLMVRLAPRYGPEASGGAAKPWHEIVGVVRDASPRPYEKSYDAMLYTPAPVKTGLPVNLLVRTQGPASALSLELQAAAVAATTDVRLVAVKSLDRVADDDALVMRVFTRIFAVVAVIALLLATAGIYALVSFTLARRTREIGIRVALGAAPRRIITSTFSRAFVQVAIGVLVGGLPGTLLLMGGVEGKGGMQAMGIAVGLGIAAFVIAVAMISCAVPLRRALKIEPMQALRAD